MGESGGLSRSALSLISAVSAVALGSLLFASSAYASIPSAYASITVPKAPTAVAAVPGNGLAVVKWTAPVGNGGSAITGYAVTSTPGSKTCATTGAKTCTIRGLTNGTRYAVWVRARNGKGLSAASAAVVVKPGVPSAPKNVRATAGNARARVAWTAPANNGSAIKRYTVRSIFGSKTCTSVVTTCTVTGLTNGTRYRFKVTATNARGTGAASAATGAVTPHLPPTLTITASSGSQTYGATPPTVTPTYSGFVNGDSPANLRVLPTCVSGTTSSSPVGTYTSSCSGAVDPNDTIVYVNGTTSVNLATLTITASDAIQIFGSALALISPIYSGFVNGDTPADLTVLPTCVSGTTRSSPVGIYTSFCSGAVDPNYTIVYVDGTITVSPATLTITASDAIQIFGGVLPVISPIYSGFVNGDSPADLTSLPTCVPGTSSSSPVLGSYVSSCSGAVDPNYTIVYVHGSTTVNPATLTITASSGSQTYGGALAVISPHYSGFVNDDSPANLTAPPICIPGTTSSSPVLGTYASSCSAAVDPNYSIGYVNGSTTVNPATLTITANPVSKLLGALDPVLTYVATGLIGSDTTTGSLTRAPGELLGKYPIELGTVTAGPNYTVVFVSNFLTILL